MTTREILIAARAKIEKPEHWTQGVYARGQTGCVTDVRAPDAYAWCAAGALEAVEGFSPFSAAYQTLQEHVDNGDLTFLGLAVFNDTHTHADVLALYDAAIAATGEVP